MQLGAARKQRRLARDGAALPGVEGAQQPQCALPHPAKCAGIGRSHRAHEIVDAFRGPGEVNGPIFGAPSAEIAAGGKVLGNDSRRAGEESGQRAFEHDLGRERHLVEDLARDVVREDRDALAVDDPARVAYDEISAAMGPGFATPFNVVVVSKDQPITDRAMLRKLDAFQEEIASDARVDSVVGPGDLYATTADLKKLPKQLKGSKKMLKTAPAGAIVDLELAFEHLHRPPTIERFDLREPTLDRVRLLHLIEDRLERITLPVPAVALRMVSGVFRPLERKNADLFEAKPHVERANALLNDAALVRKVYFPREVPILAAAAAACVDFAAGLVAFLVLGPLLGAQLSWTALLAPFLLPLVAVPVVGLTLALGALNVYYRDFRYALPLGVQLWMFASPVAYPLTKLPGDWQLLYAFLNPVAGPLEGFRRVLGLGVMPDPAPLGASLLGGSNTDNKEKAPPVQVAAPPTNARRNADEVADVDVLEVQLRIDGQVDARVGAADDDFAPSRREALQTNRDVVRAGEDVGEGERSVDGRHRRAPQFIDLNRGACDGLAGGGGNQPS